MVDQDGSGDLAEYRSFDAETPAPATLRQALGAMAHEADLRWYLLPGNHDSLAASELWQRVAAACPANVTALDTPAPVALAEGMAIDADGTLLDTLRVDLPGDQVLRDLVKHAQEVIRKIDYSARLGGEEFGFATAPLVVSGCIMMRVCHLDTCPVGVATQNPLLRQRFNGKPEFVENFFLFVAEEVRELMAQLGFRTVNEMVGQVSALDTTRAAEHWKAHKLDLTPVLHEPDSAFMNQDLYCSSRQDHGLDKALDQTMIALLRANPEAFVGGNINRLRAGAVLRRSPG